MLEIKRINIKGLITGGNAGYNQAYIYGSGYGNIYLNLRKNKFNLYTDYAYYEGIDLKICVTSGLANARTVMEQVKNGEKEYHLIEIMACRRGCIMGGGQPTRSGDRTKALRAKGLYNADNTTIIKKSDENPLVLELYNGLLKGKEHHLLHNDSY